MTNNEERPAMTDEKMRKQDLDELREVLRGDIETAVSKSLTTLLKEERKWTEDKIRQVVREEKCWCPFDLEQKDTVPRIFGMISDLGDGDYIRGLLTIRKNHVWTYKTRTHLGKWGSTAVITVLTIVVAALVGLLLAGIGLLNGPAEVDQEIHMNPDEPPAWFEEYMENMYEGPSPSELEGFGESKEGAGGIKLKSLEEDAVVIQHYSDGFLEGNDPHVTEEIVNQTLS